MKHWFVSLNSHLCFIFSRQTKIAKANFAGTQDNSCEIVGGNRTLTAPLRYFRTAFFHKPAQFGFINLRKDITFSLNSFKRRAAIECRNYQKFLCFQEYGNLTLGRDGFTSLFFYRIWIDLNIVLITIKMTHLC